MKKTKILLIGLIIIGSTAGYFIVNKRVVIPTCSSEKTAIVLNTIGESEAKKVSTIIRKKIKFIFSNIKEKSSSFGKERICSSDVLSDINGTKKLFSPITFSIKKTNMWDDNFKIKIHNFY